MRMRTCILAAFIFVPLSLAFVPSHALAQSQGAGVKIIPAQVDKHADPGQVITEDYTITNVSDKQQTYYLFSKDIKGVEGGGTPVFAPANQAPSGYEMTNWISFQSETVTVDAGKSISFPVTITVPDNATPGSHFAGIFASVQPPKLREIGAGVGYDVASIISILISGDIRDDARIRSFSTDKLVYGAPDVKFTIKVENQGNILIRPYGPLTITNMWGKQVANMTVNDTLKGVFPGSIRDDFGLTWKDDNIRFGQYKAVVALVYEGQNGNKTIDATVTFWIFPSRIIVFVTIGVALVVLLGYLLTRFYIRKIIANAGGHTISHRYRRRAGMSRFTFVFVAVLTTMVLVLIILFLFFS